MVPMERSRSSYRQPVFSLGRPRFRGLLECAALKPLSFFVACGALAGCQAAPASVAPPPSVPVAATASAASGPAPTAAAPPAPPSGERPNVACKAPHPIAPLPLASVNIDD